MRFQSSWWLIWCRQDEVKVVALKKSDNVFSHLEKYFLTRLFEQRKSSLCPWSIMDSPRVITVITVVITTVWVILITILMMMIWTRETMMIPPFSLRLLLQLHMLHVTKNILDRRGLKQPFQHTTGASMLETLVRSQRVLCAVPAIAKFTHVERIRLLVLVLKMTFQRIVAGEGTSAVRTFLRFVYTTSRWRWHLVHGRGKRRRCRMHPVARTCKSDSFRDSYHHHILSRWAAIFISLFSQLLSNYSTKKISQDYFKSYHLSENKVYNYLFLQDHFLKIQNIFLEIF